MIFLALWLLWWLGGLWLTVRTITGHRDFAMWELLPAVFTTMVAGPIVACAWCDGENSDTLFRKRTK